MIDDSHARAIRSSDDCHVHIAVLCSCGDEMMSLLPFSRIVYPLRLVCLFQHLPALLSRHRTALSLSVPLFVPLMNAVLMAGFLSLRRLTPGRVFRRVLVGAPRATSTLGIHDVPKTGALFKCGTLSQPGCREVVLDTAGG